MSNNDEDVMEEEEVATQIDPEDLMDYQDTDTDYEGETDVEDIYDDDDEIPMGAPLTRQNAIHPGMSGGKRRTKRRKTKRSTKKHSRKVHRKSHTKKHKRRSSKRRSKRRH